VPLNRRSEPPLRGVARVKRELVELLARLIDPAHGADDRQDATDDRELDVRRDADQRQSDAECGEHREDARPGEMDLLADGRCVLLEWAHDT
jgi:hypothetical protein